MVHSTLASDDIRDRLQAAITDLEHLLPGQAPIRDFVHHNTLHGLQHLPFPEALAEAERLTGACGYLKDDQYRQFYMEGRIALQDLRRVVDDDPELEAMEPIGNIGNQRNATRNLQRRDIYIAAMLHPLKPVTPNQLSWQLEEMAALSRFQPDVEAQNREILLQAAAGDGQPNEAAAISDLWRACLEGLELAQSSLHAEELLDLAPEQADRMLQEIAGDEETANPAQSMMDRLIRRETNHLLNQLLERVGKDLTLHTLLQILTGHDVLEELRPDLLRQLANYLDQGVAAWHSEMRDEGFYSVWRRSAAQDLTWIFEELPDWYSHLESLPDDPMDAVILELRRLGLRQDKWAGYLERLALELPGWSGMFLWRHLHPNYQGLTPGRVEMIDYLAVRMVLEHLFAQRLCNDLWQLEASLDLIRWHFRHHSAEFLVRHALHSGWLPEYLATLAQRLTEHTARQAPSEEAWWRLAHMVYTWRQSPVADRPVGYSVYRTAWPLFRLCQHLGLSGPQLRDLGKESLPVVIDCLDRLSSQKRGYLWLQSYEAHYRDQILTALAQNHGRGRWATRNDIPVTQVIFCMDDREEGTRRHLEELEPDIETLGAAAHFNVPHNWRGLDDREVTALAPVIPTPVIPAHEVDELPQPQAEQLGRRHRQRRLWLENIHQGLLHEGRRGLLIPTLMTAAAAPLQCLVLIGKLVAPARVAAIGDALRDRFEGEVPTYIDFLAADDSPPASPESPRLGFTDLEQADRVQQLLRGGGLIAGFAPLVAIVGHGSHNQNNPHAPAYNCGACSGRFSGPNARLVAAMANRTPVRQLLADRGIEIPAATWFLGGEHDTCNDEVTWFDIDAIPDASMLQFDHLRERLGEACRLHTQERCRRFASAPDGLGTEAAYRHVVNRGQDISQARPELGHATNACAFFGRRAMSRGAFFDRRAFLISYDPTQDPEGEILERHLLINGAVGAGISLEYYFSTVDNDRYGCGSKVTHNVTGHFGVMDGSASDLRTGLPRQMIEIHEAMRLLVVVEQSMDLLTAIYQRQPAIQELVGNGWVQLAAMDPDNGTIHLFQPDRGWVSWQPSQTALPSVGRSMECYAGHSGPCPPALIASPDHAHD